MQKIFAKLKRYYFKLFVLPGLNREFIAAPARFESIVSANPNKLFVILISAYDVDMISLHYTCVKKYLKDDYEYFVLDNANDLDRSVRVKEYCVANKINYIRLPENKASRWGYDGSLFHGLGLNWGFYNVVERFKPRYFGYVDADLFPVEPVRVSDYLDRTDAWGITMIARPFWHFWSDLYYMLPTLAFFRRERFKSSRPNFLPFWGVDTGGKVKGVDPEAAFKIIGMREMVTQPHREVAPGVWVFVHWKFVHFGSGSLALHDLGAQKHWIEGKLR